jgi:uncharacterized coiled-coil DUF342 family protein
MRRNNMTAKIAELEDIICTMQFQINGLKSVIHLLEEERKADKERVEGEAQLKIQEVMGEADQLRAMLETRRKEVDQWKEKVSYSSPFPFPSPPTVK